MSLYVFVYIYTYIYGASSAQTPLTVQGVYIQMYN